jgi:hypothetical protein
MLALDRGKLAKMLGMLGSRHDGEVASAGRSAHTLINDAGITWTEVLTAPDGADPVDRNTLAEAEAENRRLVIELAQRQLDIYNLIAKHQQEIRELQGAKPRDNTRGSASIKTMIGWAAMGLAVWLIGAMIGGAQRTQEVQVLRGGSLAAPLGTEAWQLNNPPSEIDPSSLFRWINEHVQGWSRVPGGPAQHSPALKAPTRTQ